MLKKVCGMCEAANIRAVEALGVDWLGFIFWPKSSRYVSVMPDYLPVRAKRVGVFVDETVANVKAKAEAYRLDLIQLHGQESSDYLRTLRKALDETNSQAATPALIKAFPIATAADLAACADYEGVADYFLFDTHAALPGGNGRQFDWSVLADYDGTTPFLLSGGIGPDDSNRVRTFHHPRCIGIDLNSRFELSPGVKDVEALHKFLNQTDNEQNQHSIRPA